MSIKTQGVNHPALIGQHRDETVKFYTEILGMRLVLDQPNLDESRMTHLFFDAGGGGFIAYFVINEGTELAIAPAKDGIGAMGHLALNLAGPIEGAMETLDKHGIKYMGPVDRGYERSIYFRDPNNVLVELLTWITPLPEGASEADVVARATEIKNVEGAYAIDDGHVRQAMSDLGYPPIG